MAVIAGLVIGRFATEGVIGIILPIKHILGQVIFFLIPLIVFGFITPAITRLKSNASKLLTLSLVLAYVSCVGSSVLAALVGYNTIPLLDITPGNEGSKALPEMIFRLDIPPLMPVLSSLVLAFLVGVGILLTKSRRIENALYEFQDIVFVMVKRVLIPLLPFFIAANFSVFAYEGNSDYNSLPYRMAYFFICVCGNIFGQESVAGAQVLRAGSIDRVRIPIVGGKPGCCYRTNPEKSRVEAGSKGFFHSVVG